jgi:hypothetical protein
MRLFRTYKDALDHVAAGGQALCVFKLDENFGRMYGLHGYLLDAERPRLLATARQLGIRGIVIEGRGERQCVRLFGRPLRKALLKCENIEIGRERDENQAIFARWVGS